MNGYDMLEPLTNSNIAYLEQLMQGFAMSQNKRIHFPNTIQTPNILIDYWMPLLSSAEFKVIMFITRETFGYGCRETTNKDYSSINTIAERTGLNRDTVIEAIKVLIEHQLIIKIHIGKSNIYKINIYDPSQVGNSDQSSMVGNSDHNQSDSPTEILQPHTYNTKENKSVCAEPELVAPNPPEKVIKKKTDGTSFEISRNQLIEMSVRIWKEWSMEDIDALWEIVRDYPNPINDLVKFCDGTLKNRKIMSGIKKIKDKPCLEKTQLQKKESHSNKKESSDQGSWGRPLENWKSQIGRDKKS